MRKQILMILTLLAGLALAACQAGAAAPPPATPLPTETPSATPLPPTETPAPTPTITLTPPLNSQYGPPLLSIHMFTPMRGWGILENQLLATNDGGVTWAGVPVPGGAFDGYNGTYFLNEKQAFILVASPDGNGGLLNYTMDGGQTWETVPVPAAHGRVQFRPDTDREGFIYQDLGVAAGSMAVAVYQTLDRATWVRTFAHVEPGEVAGLPFAGVKTGAFFINPSVGWITGSEPVETSIYFFRTDDAGRNWRRVELPLPEGIANFSAETRPPFFFEGVKGFLPVDFLNPSGESQTYFYYSEDSGNTWAPRASIPRASTYEFVDASTGWAWAGRQLFYTTDGAVTWAALPVSFPAREAATCLNFIDQRNGWLITVDDKSRVHLYRTADAGSTWSVIIP